MKLINYFFICTIFILSYCNPKKEEAPIPLHTVIDGFVRDSSNNNPVVNYEVVLTKKMKYEPNGDKDLYNCLTDSNGYYKFNVYLLPEKDYNYIIGGSYNAVYYRGSSQPTGYYDILSGQNKTINIYLIKSGN